MGIFESSTISVTNLEPTTWEILCYPWQSQFVDRYIGGRAQLREIGLPDLEDALGLGAGEGADEGS